MDPVEIARQTCPRRAEIGRIAAARLAAAGAQHAASPYFTLWYIEDFLPPEDCAFLIERIDACRQPSILLSDAPDQRFRTSDSGNLDRWDPAVRAIDRRVCDLLGIDERHGETLQGQRYAPGQYFRAHCDFFDTSQSYWPDQEASGGQRTWTAMIYLNQPEAGGETAFPTAGLTVAPRPGLLLAWDNMDATGAPNLHAGHEGKDVIAGVKYIVTKWFRERPWV